MSEVCFSIYRLFFGLLTLYILAKVLLDRKYNFNIVDLMILIHLFSTLHVCQIRIGFMIVGYGAKIYGNLLLCGIQPHTIINRPFLKHQ